MNIIIDGSEYEVDKVLEFGYLPLICCGKVEFYVAEDSESAGEATAKYYQDMAHNDPKEFIALIGEERMVGWAIGQGDSFGISSFKHFLDAVAEVPEEQWAGYDGIEREVEEIEEPEEVEEPLDGNADTNEYDAYLERKAKFEGWEELIEELGFTPTVAYRHN